MASLCAVQIPLQERCGEGTLERILASRIHINTILSETILRRTANAELAGSCLSSTLPGRKVRSFLFLETLRELGVSDYTTETADVIFAIECSHAGSVLLDDLLDGDDLRHGETSIQRSWAVSKRTLLAHYLAATALSAVQFDDVLYAALLAGYEAMTLGEMYDLLIPEGTDWMECGYGDLVARKTFPLFDFSLHAAARLASVAADRVLALRASGRAIGRLYQLSNDYYDWKASNLSKRHLPGTSWPITFSFPLATYLRRYGVGAIKSELSAKSLSHEAWREFLTVIWTPEVEMDCRIAMRRAGVSVRSACTELSPNLQRLYSGIVDMLAEEDFWYHTFHRHSTSVGE